MHDLSSKMYHLDLMTACSRRAINVCSHSTLVLILDLTEYIVQSAAASATWLFVPAHDRPSEACTRIEPAGQLLHTALPSVSM